MAAWIIQYTYIHIYYIYVHLTWAFNVSEKNPIVFRTVNPSERAIDYYGGYTSVVGDRRTFDTVLIRTLIGGNERKKKTKKTTRLTEKNKSPRNELVVLG